ncbi:hypothetical protein [Alteromonas sp. a30]|uniref:hypothetical protein n=1 Tax=Alteromonas sp. a30 TaxID=2730917 RepID=UPI002281A97F|nr:hypothetical protein [Alteromonas sp. a30]MCY7296901.1 hypothetical protein [Alteromonas sp. a30]
MLNDQCSFGTAFSTIHSIFFGDDTQSFSTLMAMCGGAVGFWGSIASILSILLPVMVYFFKAQNKKKEDAYLDYYQKTLHPKDFEGLTELSPKQKGSKRNAEALFEEIEAYRNKAIIGRYEWLLHRALAAIQRFFKEPEWQVESVANADVKADVKADVNADAEANALAPSLSANGKAFWQQQKQLATGLFSEGSYRFCLMLAFVYPILFAMVNGLRTNEVRLANLPLIAFESGWDKALFIVGGLMVLFPLLGIVRSEREWKKVFYLLLGFLGLVAIGKGGGFILFLIAFGGFFAFTSTSVSFATIAVPSIISVSYSAASVSDSVVVLVIAVIVFKGLYELTNKFFFGRKSRTVFKQNLYFAVISLTYLMASCWALLIYGEEKTFVFILVPLLLGILPLLNAPIDWLSLNVTRYLSYQMSQHHAKKRFLALFLLVDIIFAVFFMLVITSTMLGVITLANHVAVWFNAPPLLPFADILQGMVNPATYNQYYWVHFMVLSTLVPTVIHFVLLLVSITLFPLGHAKQQAYQHFYEDQHHHGYTVMQHQQKKRVHLFYSGLLATAVIGALIVNFDWAGCQLWNYADWFLGLIDTHYQSPVLRCG